MRICLYTETALPVIGGQELAVDALARRFLSRGHEVVVLTLRPRQSQPGDDAGLPYPVVRHRRYRSTRHFLGFYTQSIHRVYRRFPFDVLHCHNVYPAGYVAWRWAASRHVPLVITSHACDIAEESLLLKKPQIPPRIALVLQQAAAVIAISESVVPQLTRLSTGKCRMVRIPNGVDVDDYREPVARPSELSPAIRPRGYFLFLGRLVPRKGVDLLLDAFSRIAATTDADLVIAGTGAEEAGLRARVAASGLGERVHFVGVVQSGVKTYLLQNALCAVIPSRTYEGSSLVVLESYAAGLPVIATRIPGLMEVVEHDRTGLLVPPESSPDLAQAMAALAADRVLAPQLGDTARRIVQASDWSNIADRHLELYAEVSGGRTAPNRSSSFSASGILERPAASA